MDPETLKAQVRQLLSEEPAGAVRRASEAFDRLAEPFQDSLVLFGAGNLGRRTLAGLRKSRLEPLAFADNNPALWGRSVDGLEVLSPDEAARRYATRAVFVVTIWRAGGTHRLEHTRRQLQALGCARVASCGHLFWKYPAEHLPHYCLDLPHKVLGQASAVLEAASLWADERSRREYLAQLRWRLALDFDGLFSPGAEEQYFPDGLFSWDPQEVFVDCGAYDGDTLRSVVRRFGPSFANYVALEPDPSNFRKMQTYVATLPGEIQNKLVLLPLAAGARREKVLFDAAGSLSSAIGSGSAEVECAPLDELLGERVPTYVKMDIEGAELDALAGSRHLIEEHVPLLALCVYHRQDHLWRIPLYVRSLSSQYRFFLRPHNEECWDLVCYAVPE